MPEELKENLSKQLTRDEGVKYHAYKDHLGYLTIGVGRLIDERKGGAISPEESDYLLSNDIDRILSAWEKYPWYDNLDDARKGVLCNMSFQLGMHGVLKFAKMLKYVQDGDYLKASLEMLDSRWATQTPERAVRLSLQMETGIWQIK